ncbi:MAG: damage-inducible protein DinB [Hyphomicrobiales bacterium]|nr:MAG: damage-inducible protein DinB [Hyphomicrobiales bacterium]
MIDVAYPRLMARYNRWQNRSIYAAAGRLDDAGRRVHRGAFFGSIQATLCHILWADQTWMVRLADWPPPPARTIRDSVGMIEAWMDLAAARARFDDKLVGWADALEPADLEGTLTWFSGAAGRNMTKPRETILVHIFNHQTHHRGQVHAMLTAAGAMPDDTDIPFMPEE